MAFNWGFQVVLVFALKKYTMTQKVPEILSHLDNQASC
jgi:hypothetical protein